MTLRTRIKRPFTYRITKLVSVKSLLTSTSLWIKYKKIFVYDWYCVTKKGRGTGTLF